jgi:multicomponent Na+:H+ antiporter subunit F
MIWLVAAVGECLVAAVVMVRLVLGPTTSDRVVAVNTMAAQVTLALLCFSVWADRTVYLDVALWLAAFSYLGAFVWARYLERGLL